MFEKKQKKQSLLDKLPSSYEDVTGDPKRWISANRFYNEANDTMYTLKPTGVIEDMNTGELIQVSSPSTIKELVFVGKCRLFIDKDAKFVNHLPEELRNVREEEKSQDNLSE